MKKAAIPVTTAIKAPEPVRYKAHEAPTPFLAHTKASGVWVIYQGEAKFLRHTQRVQP